MTGSRTRSAVEAGMNRLDSSPPAKAVGTDPCDEPADDRPVDERAPQVHEPRDRTHEDRRHEIARDRRLGVDVQGEDEKRREEGSPAGPGDPDDKTDGEAREKCCQTELHGVTLLSGVE